MRNTAVKSEHSLKIPVLPYLIMTTNAFVFNYLFCAVEVILDL